jgi:transposase
MPTIHPKARTTPAVRAEIARSTEPTGVLARRYGVSTETIRKWRKRGPADCQDHSSRPHKLPWKATEEERAIVCALRRATGFPLDDLTFVVTHFLPHLNRDAVYRILKAEGLGRLAPASRPRKPTGTFKDYDLGFVHVDVKHLPKLRTQDGESRKRSLYVAIDRASRFVHLAVKDDETERSAVAFLKEAVRAFPFQVTHVLTDRGCGVPNARGGASHDAALHAQNQWDGGALQRAYPARGARHYSRQPPRSGNPSARLQPGLQCSTPARARGAITRNVRA